tara:strand:- start:52 stop:909 length:858 start_codon:yes stop_codon:yes gene_type:complete
MNKPLYGQINTISKKYVLSKIDQFLSEDSPNGDPTTELTVDNKKNTSALFICEDECVFAGEQILTALNDDFKINIFTKDGTLLQKGQKIAQIDGNARQLLKLERILLNLLQRLSGIASLTKQYVNQVNSSGIKILDTRKTTPGLRLFEKYAVKVGGGYNHRLDLSSGLLIKDNHWVASKDDFYKIIRDYNLDLPIQVEVDNIAQLTELLEYRIDAILLDNMSPEYAQKCVDIIRSKSKSTFIEISGGVTLENLSDYIIKGVDGISSGALMHQAQNQKIKLEFMEV